MAPLIQNMSDITSVSARWRVFARVEENICTGVELQTSGPGLSGLTRTENLSAAVKNKSSGGLKNISLQHFKRAQMLPQYEQGLTADIYSCRLVNVILKSCYNKNVNVSSTNP